MTSIAQIKANQRNAKKSTGPKTRAGKTKSSQNAMTHGIFASVTLLPGEDEKNYQALADQIMNDLAPTDAIELGFVERIIIGRIRQNRLREAESARLKMNMSDEVIAQRLQTMLNGQNIQITADQISDQFEFNYQFYTKVNQEFREYIDIDGKVTINFVKTNAPNIYALLPRKAEEYKLDWQEFISNLSQVNRAIAEIRTEAKNYVEQKAYYHRVYQLKNDMKIASRVLHGEDLAQFSKYQVQLDTDIIRAMEALRKYREDKAKVVEGQIIE